MKEILYRIPAYKMFRAFGYPRILPASYTLGLTYRCNSRCKTCNVYEKKANELSVEEYRKIFAAIGKSPYWITFSGGEPFLRTDIVDIAESVYTMCRPNIINIPTNGLLWQRIPGKVEEILKKCPETDLIINLSLDNTGKAHDDIRGIKDNFEKSMKTYEALRALKYPRLTLGIHTVISKYNVDEFADIHAKLIALKPDSYITEIAEEREELGTIGAGITPTAEQYTKAINVAIAKMKSDKAKGIANIARSFRLEYYAMVKRVLVEKRQILPCYAGFMSVQIAPDGDVWPCCIKANVMGNLRDVDYDFKKVWQSAKANEIREKIRKKTCHCPLANAAYTNMLCNLKTLAKVSARLIAGK